MPLGIDPKIDFAFKRMLGSPEHPAVTIHFLNAVLQLKDPVTHVEILNPLAGKQRVDDKPGILDVLARDSLGRRFNIEMQTTLPEALRERLLYYNCRNYLRQITEGEPYVELRPAISICVLDRVMFANIKPYHLSFRVRCDQHANLVFSDDLEFHTLELPKFVPVNHNAVSWSAVDKWAYLLRFASELEAVQLAELLADDPFREAIGVLKMISNSEEEMLLYENRVKAARDEQAKLNYARTEGLQEGVERGSLQGRVQPLQELLGEQPASVEVLASLSLVELASLESDLQTRLRNRPAK